MTGSTENVTSALAARDNTAETPFRSFTIDFFESKVATMALCVVGGVFLSAVFAPLISQQNPFDLAQLNILDSRLPPGSKGWKGITYWLGTDDQGRDMLSAILYGLRTSLWVAAVSQLIALALGMTAGLIAAYCGRWVDSIIMRTVDIQLSFPAILVAVILIAVLGRGVDKVIIALIVAKWAYYARTARGVALVERRKEYIEAAICLALSHRYILFTHLLPNCLSPLIVVGAIQISHAIALEATLSFLGVGVPVTEPSLGLLIASGFEYLLSGKYWISFFPGVALLISIFSINIVGDHIRTIWNPRLQK